MKNSNIGFLGCGNMAQAMIAGLIQQGFAASHILSFDPDQKKLKDFARKTKIKALASNEELLKNSTTLVVAIKPQEIKKVFAELKKHFSKQLIISIAAGIPLSTFKKFAPQAKLVRSMPNNPALIGQGITALFTKDLGPNEVKSVEKIFRGCGKTLWVKKEEDLDAVTGLSGSGPAYVYAFVEALKLAGEKSGLDSALSYELALQTVLGAALTLERSGKKPEELIPLVTSKKGTTLEGLKILKKYKLNSLLEKTVKAATGRAREIRKELA